MAKTVRYFALREGTRETHVFSTRSGPRAAALKAATRGFTSIVLRERGRRNSDGTYSLHKYKGSRKKVAAPANRPSWLPAQVWKPTVRKSGVDRIRKL